MNKIIFTSALWGIFTLLPNVVYAQNNIDDGFKECQCEITDKGYICGKCGSSMRTVYSKDERGNIIQQRNGYPYIDYICNNKKCPHFHKCIPMEYKHVHNCTARNCVKTYNREIKIKNEDRKIVTIENICKLNKVFIEVVIKHENDSAKMRGRIHKNEKIECPMDFPKNAKLRIYIKSRDMTINDI